uniref:Uncharacterized protein n=1 Tax=Pararge aegeria TaxID=116150 RepID=S4NSK4_9NEOP
MSWTVCFQQLPGICLMLSWYPNVLPMDLKTWLHTKPSLAAMLRLSHIQIRNEEIRSRTRVTNITLESQS